MYIKIFFDNYYLFYNNFTVNQCLFRVFKQLEFPYDFMLVNY